MMIINKRYYLMILFAILCSIHTIAQTDFYYYKGKKIPLTVNQNKICVSIPKEYERTNEQILANTKVINKITDKYFNIYIILQTDLDKLTTLDFWKEGAKYVRLIPTYITTDKSEVFITPYIT